MTDKIMHILEYIGEDHPEFLNNDVVSKETYLKSVTKYANELWEEAEIHVEIEHEYCRYCGTEICPECLVCTRCNSGHYPNCPLDEEDCMTAAKKEMEDREC